MNYLELGIFAILASALAVGIILGLARGSRRSVLRLVLIFLCIFAAFFLKNLATDKILAVEISSGNETVTVQQMIINRLPEEVQSLENSVIVPLIRSIVGIVMFLLLFWVAKFVTWLIVYPICKLFIKPKIAVDADGNKVVGKNGQVVRKNHRLIGAGIGLISGFVVALCICVPLSGLIIQTNRVIVAVEELEQSQATSYAQESNALAFADEGYDGSASSENGTSSSLGQLLPNGLLQMISDYDQTAAGKFFGGTCSPLFDALSRVTVETTDESGNVTERQITLSGQVGTVEKLLPLATQLLGNSETITQITEQISSISSSENSLEELKSLNEDGSAIKELFTQLDETTSELTEEQKETVNEVISAVLDSVEVSTDNEAVSTLIDTFKDTLQETDFTDIEFTKELEVVDSLATIVESVSSTASDEETLALVSEAINQISESTLILPVLESMDDLDLNLSEEDKASVQEILDNLPDTTDQETLDTVKSLLGIE